MDALSEFISVERGRYEGDEHRFTLAFMQVLRYYEFISIISRRYEAASAEFTSDLAEQISAISSGDSGSSPMTDEEIERMYKSRQLAGVLHLEIESFYLFAKILLGKIAHSVEDCFGQAFGASMRSHDQFTKNHEQFAEKKGLEYPPGFAKTLTSLQELVEYRDKQIEHQNNPRVIRATSFSLDDSRTRISTTHVYPMEHDKPALSEEVLGLRQAIDDYIDQVIVLITTNRDKSRFKLRGS